MKRSTSLIELKAKLAAANQRVRSASDELEVAVEGLKQATTGSPDWQRAASVVAAAHLELVKLKGGLTAEGRTLKGEVPSLEEQIREAATEEAWTELGHALAEIEDSLRDRFAGELASLLSELSVSRVDFQVAIDSMANPTVSAVRHGGRTSAHRQPKPGLPSLASKPTTNLAPDTGRWNGEYYVSFGVWEGRSWEEARRYGFISGGGGLWYSRTLKLLTPGDRVWVNVPKRGYVGVGCVTGTAVIAADFQIMVDGRERMFLDIAEASYMREFADDVDKAEYFVPVEWIGTKPLDFAISEVGFFGNQNTVCRPSTPKWEHTVERLKQRFQVE